VHDVKIHNKTAYFLSDLAQQFWYFSR